MNAVTATYVAQYRTATEFIVVHCSLPDHTHSA